MFSYQLDRQAKLRVTVEHTDISGKRHKGSFSARMNMIPRDEAKALVDRGEPLIDVILDGIYPDEWDLTDKAGKPITDPDLIREAVLNDMKLAGAVSDAYWSEVNSKKP